MSTKTDKNKVITMDDLFNVDLSKWTDPEIKNDEYMKYAIPVGVFSEANISDIYTKDELEARKYIRAGKPLPPDLHNRLMESRDARIAEREKNTIVGHIPDSFITKMIQKYKKKH